MARVAVSCSSGHAITTGGEERCVAISRDDGAGGDSIAAEEDSIAAEEDSIAAEEDSSSTRRTTWLYLCGVSHLDTIPNEFRERGITVRTTNESRI